MNSIRRQLVLWLLAVLLVVGATTGLVTYVSLEYEVGDLFDDQMLAVGQSLRNESDLNFSLSVPPGNDRDSDDFIIEVFDNQNRLISSSDPSVKVPLTHRTGFADVHWNGDLWRTVAVPKDRHTILVVQSMAARDATRKGIALRSLWPQVIFLPVMALIIWVVVGRSIRPIKSITTELRARSLPSLEPLSIARLPEEIEPLVVAINDLMQRLDGALQVQQQFIADAAHELRTPLTAVDLQAQLLERAGTESERAYALESLRLGLRRATRVVNQLLTLARVEPGGIHAAHAPVQLDATAKQTISDFQDVAKAKRIDLGAAWIEHTRIMGDGDGVRTLIANLVDNAIRYTPDGGKVDVSVIHVGANACVQVADSGPGIPPQDADRVFSRFYRRPGTSAEGSGLGLAIVKRLAEQHQAHIQLGPGLNGAGLCVSVEFPPLQA